ncbi:MAG: dihydropteroate synthase [Spirochaetes bacterium]|nr:dihydropteroate synthase [Spirochaetota bacterium]
MTGEKGQGATEGPPVEGPLALGSGRSLPGGVPIVMGIINATPDSFFPGSRAGTIAGVVEAGLRMAAEGALVIDVGGESTRPGAAYVGEAEERERVAPAIAALRKALDAGGFAAVAISVDTRKASVAKAALDSGAWIVNDVSALCDDPAMPALVADRGVCVVLMHKKGTPDSMQDKPWYDDCLGEVSGFLFDAARRAESAGVGRDLIWIDPGIGFGKRLSDNLELLARLDAFVASGYPVLVGVSRKSFIGALTGKAVEDRLAGTLAATVFARAKGARIFRVHDVAATVDALCVQDALASQGARTRKTAEGNMDDR